MAHRETPIEPTLSSDLHVLRDRLLNALPESETGAAEADLATQTTDGGWGDIDYADLTRGVWSPRQHLLRVRTLALRWRAGGGATFLTSSLAGIAEWVRRDPVCPNWWHNQIGCPRLLAESVLVVQAHLPTDLLAATRTLLDRAMDAAQWAPEGPRPAIWTGANRLWISAVRLITGAISEDESLVALSISSAMSEVRVSPIGREGIQADGSFHQHGPLLYNGGYGASYVKECVFFLHAAHGTRWQPNQCYHALLADFLLDGTRWMLRGEDPDPGCCDREVTRPWPWLWTKPQASAVEFLAGVGLPRAAELANFAAALARGEAPGSLEGNRMFYRSDFMVQQRAGFYISVRMYSRRTVRAECCNSEGRLSHHVADGMTCLLKNGSEYRDIFPVWNWGRLPGATCLQTPRPEPEETVRALGRELSTGGVSDGRFGACTQFLCNDHLSVRKSWFFGPEGAVCLGAGIQSAYAGQVVTALDQSLRQGPVEWSGAPSILADGRHALADARWVKHGFWGFVFPAPQSLIAGVSVQTGAWSRIGGGSSAPVEKEVFSAWIEHGEAPANATYAYAILPGADREALDRVAATPAWQIVENTTRAQAVWRPEAGLFQAIFFRAGEITWGEGWTLRVGQECAVMAVQEKSGAWRIEIADTRQVGGMGKIALLASDGRTILSQTVTWPDGDNRGRTVRCG